MFNLSKHLLKNSHLQIIYLIITMLSLMTSLNLCEAAPPSKTHSVTKPFHPNLALNELFETVQMSKVFEDSKTFVDATLLASPQHIMTAYLKARSMPDFNLKSFVLRYFKSPQSQKVLPSSRAKSSVSSDSMVIQLMKRWELLMRTPNADSPLYPTTLIKLPYPYVVPGGRFREIYYWDSYFTLLGLVHSDQLKLVKSMVDNFADLIDRVGFIPNGNRSYFLSRSQPPFFGEMVRLLEEREPGQGLLYLKQLETEYQFWMNGSSQLSQETPAMLRVVRLSEHIVLNRYYDQLDSPRPESYREDRELAESLHSVNPKQLYRDLRAACESGWDFSSRWFADGKTLKTIVTTQVIPVDLNVLLYRLEHLLADLTKRRGNAQKAQYYRSLADQRQRAINQVLWNHDEGFYRDFNFQTGSFTPVMSLAGLFPLWAKIATQPQADRIVTHLKRRFLFPGGLVTTPHETGQQWDYPNGWAPLHWIAVQGLHNYHYDQLAYTVARRWLALNERIFAQDRKMMEKYNVVDLKLKAGGGEYPTQDGFGWTNGVALALHHLLPKLKSEVK